MAPMSRRKPAPRRKAAAPRNTARGGAMKPVAHVRNSIAGHMRAASYSRHAAMRMAMAITAGLLAVILLGLWLGGFMPQVRDAGSKFTQNRLVAMGFVIERVDVIGEGRIREDEVRAALGVYPGEYLFGPDMRAAQINVQRLSWVDDAMVRRLWPNRIVVHIIEREPVALWQENGNVGVVDKDGLIIEAAMASDFAGLPLVVGTNAAPNAQGIYDALAGSSEVSARLSAIVRIGDRRWDIALKDGAPRLMLPETDPAGALARVEQMHKTHGVLDLDLELIDLRNSGRAILRPRSARLVKKGAA